MYNWKLIICGIGMLLSVAFGLQVSIEKSTYEVDRGSEVTITCKFQPKNQVNSLIVITWSAEFDGSFDDEEITFGTFYSNDGHVDIDSLYEGKAQIVTDTNERTSKLILKQATLRESRTIKCQVQIPGDNVGQTWATTSLVVLIAPSNPVCKIKGTTQYYQNISLTCVSDEGYPLPTYKWQSYDFTNASRNLPLKAIDDNGVLSLFNVSEDASGYYICISTNKVRSASCNLTLSVGPPTMNINATAGIIGGCIAGLAVLVLIIYCCCKKKKQPEEFSMGPPVVEYHDQMEKEKREEDAENLRKPSIEGSIDQREKFELKTEKNTYLQSSEDDDRSSSQHFEYDDHQKRATDRQKDNRSDRHNERRDRGDERSDRGDNRSDRGDDRSDRGNDRRDRSDDRDNYNRGRYDDHRGRYDDHRDHYDDRRDHYDDRRDHHDDRYDDHRDRYDDRRDRDRYDDRRDRYDVRRDRYDDRRDRYDDRQVR